MDPNCVYSWMAKFQEVFEYSYMGMTAVTATLSPLIFVMAFVLYQKKSDPIHLFITGMACGDVLFGKKKIKIYIPTSHLPQRVELETFYTQRGVSVA